MATVILSIVLLAVGLVLAFYQAQAIDLIRSTGVLPNDLQRTVVQLVGERFVAYGFLAAAPILLIVGSLVKGI
jgi:hypothetical protein